MSLESCIKITDDIKDKSLAELETWRPTPQQMKIMLMEPSEESFSKQSKIFTGILVTEEVMRMNFELTKVLAGLSFEDFTTYQEYQADVQTDTTFKMTNTIKKVLTEHLYGSMLYDATSETHGDLDN